MLYSLISPAKRQNRSVLCPIQITLQPHFKSEIQILMKLLQQYSIQDLADLMSISEALATLNHTRFSTFEDKFTEKNSYPAAFLFQGDVYQGLNVSAWSEDDCTWAQAHLGILSGLYGWLRPLDLIQPYRLEMKTRLKNSNGQDLYAYWGNKVTQAIAQHLDSIGCEWCVNLASIEYAKVIQFDALPARSLDVAFKEPGPQGLRTVAIRAKKARGLMAAYLIQQRIQTREGLQGFKGAGYVYAPEHSSAQCDVFVRQV
jgi:uncharacterized protein